MARIAEITLVQEVRGFGWRVFGLADAIDSAAIDSATASTGCERLARVRQAAAGASRHVAKSARALEGRVAQREVERAFKDLSDCVTLLDEVGFAHGSVEASALAAEATALAEKLYDLVGAC